MLIELVQNHDNKQYTREINNVSELHVQKNLYQFKCFPKFWVVVVLVENIYVEVSCCLKCYKGRGSARQIGWFLRLFTILFNKSCRSQGCFLKFKTSRVMPIYGFYFFITKCTNQKQFKFIADSFLSLMLLS